MWYDAGDYQRSTEMDEELEYRVALIEVAMLLAATFGIAFMIGVAL